MRLQKPRNSSIKLLQKSKNKVLLALQKNQPSIKKSILLKMVTLIVDDKDPLWFTKKISSNRKAMFIKAIKIIKQYKTLEKTETSTRRPS